MFIGRRPPKKTPWALKPRAIYIICLMILILCNCSHIKFRDAGVTDKILSLKKGDLISIELMDDTRIECVFIKQEKWEIVIGIIENDVLKEKSVKISSIYKIRKQSENKVGPPKTVTTIIMVIIFYGLLLWTSYLAGIGKLGS